MRSAASRREEIQKKLEVIRQERERERRAFDELVLQHENMTPAEICEAARKRALEEEPTSIKVGDTVVSVGDYVKTIDDVHIFFAAEKGIFGLDPVKQAYLGERAKVIRVWPSFQGKAAVELLFADGAAKVFLTECLSVGRNARKLRKTSSLIQSENAAHADPEAICVPEFVLPPKPEPLPLPTWSTISGLGDKTKLKGEKNESKIVSSSVQSVALKDNDTTPLGSCEEEHYKDYPTTSRGSQCSLATTQAGSEDGEYVSIDQSIGLVKEVLSGRRRVSVEERLGSPLDFNAVPAVPLAGHGEHDNLLKTPRVDFSSYRNPKECKKALTTGISEKCIPTSCPTDYKAQFSLGDKTTGIPRLDGRITPSNSEGCMVAGVKLDKSEMKFCSVVFERSADSLETMLSVVTQELGWHLEGLKARRLFTKEGVEITHVDDIRNGMFLVVTPGHTYCIDKAPLPPPSPPSPSPSPAPASALPLASRTITTARTTVTPTQNVVWTGGTAKTRRSFGDTTSASASVRSKNMDRQQRPLTTPSLSSQSLLSSKLVLARSAQQLAPRVAGKGILKPISVRVFSNGEYGDSRNDCLPFRTVTLRPIHKTMRAIVNTIERELEWHSMGKKIDKLYDALGGEIVSLEELADGQAIVASTGDDFVVPHSSTVLYHDTVKLLGGANLTPLLNRDHASSA